MSLINSSLFDQQLKQNLNVMPLNSLMQFCQNSHICDYDRTADALPFSELWRLQNLNRLLMFSFKFTVHRLTDTGLSWPQKASRIFARLFSHALNKNQVVLNFLLPDIDIVNNLLTINKIKIRNKISTWSLVWNFVKRQKFKMTKHKP